MIQSFRKMPRVNLGIGDKNDEVETPEYLKEFLEERYGKFDFDPCPFPRPDWNGLEVDWKKLNFINPPFSEIPKWLKKGMEELKKGRKSVFLLTARTSSKYWFDLVFPNATDLLFLEGGVIFKGYENRFPVPIVIVEFDPEKDPMFNLNYKHYTDKLRFLSIDEHLIQDREGSFISCSANTT
jgi:hypothetical protein